MDVYLFFALNSCLYIGNFHIFNIASKMVAKGHVTIFFIIGLNKSFI